MTKNCIFFVERNVHGAWVVYGTIAVRQYYGYTKQEAMRRYREECARTELFNQRGKRKKPEKPHDL